MISKPNFILSIKQTFLHNKEIFHMHNTHKSILHHSYLPCYLLDLDSTKSCSHRRSHLCLRSTSQASRAPPITDLCKSRLYLMKPTTQTCSTAYCNQYSGNLFPSAATRTSMRRHRLQPSSHAPPRILNSLIGF